MRRFSELDKHYDRHNEGVCSVCGCTTDRWKSMCDSCRYEIAAVQGLIKDVQGLIKKEELKEQERNKDD